MRSIKYLQKSNKIVQCRKIDENRLQVLFILSVVLFSMVLLYSLPKSFPSRAILESEGRSKLNNEIRIEFIKLGLKEIHVKTGNSKLIHLAFMLNKKHNETTLRIKAKKVLDDNGFSIQKTENLKGKRGFSIFTTCYDYPIGSITFLKRQITDLNNFQLSDGVIREKPKLAIVIDDFGNSNNEVIQGFFELDIDITVSVIPGHNFSAWASQTAVKFGKEVMIHMPMEPEDSRWAGGEEQYILSGMLQPFQVKQRIEAACRELPEAIGMNNHMGSLATSDIELMTIVMKKLKEKGMYFVDSLTSPKSIAYEIAMKAGVPAGIRAVFLDNDPKMNKIKEQFTKAIEIAQRSGEVLVIGHVHKQTLDTIKQLVVDGSFSEVNISFASQIVTSKIIS